MGAKKLKGGRANQPWTAKEEALLRRLYLQNVTVDEMTILLGRSHQAIRNRVSGLGLAIYKGFTGPRTLLKESDTLLKESDTLLTPPPRKARKPLAPLAIEVDKPITLTTPPPRKALSPLAIEAEDIRKAMRVEAEKILFSLVEPPVEPPVEAPKPSDNGELGLLLDFVRMAWGEGHAVVIPALGATFQKGEAL